MAERSMEGMGGGGFCGQSLAGKAGSNTADGIDISCLSKVYCLTDISATGRFLVQRNPTDCDVSK